MGSIEEDARIIRALVEWSGDKPAAIARTIKVANTTINRPFAGTATTRISTPTWEKIRSAYPDFPEWVVDSDQPSASADVGYVAIDVLPSYAGMGGGGTGEGDKLVAKLSRRMIEEDLRGKPADFLLIDVRGDSMAPEFLHGDQILVDRRDRDPAQPGPFAIFDGDAYVLKLIERVPQRRGWYRIFSASDRYTPYEIEEAETTIMGRPVWFSRRL